MRKIFHVRVNEFARAFVMPDGMMNRIYLWYRGYRPFSTGGWWHKPSPNQRKLEKSFIYY